MRQLSDYELKHNLSLQKQAIKELNKFPKQMMIAEVLGEDTKLLQSIDKEILELTILLNDKMKRGYK